MWVASGFDDHDYQFVITYSKKCSLQNDGIALNLISEMGSIWVTKIWRTCFHRPHNGHHRWCSGHLVRKRGKSAMHPSLLWHFQRHPPPAQPIAFSCSCKYSIVGNSVITCLWTKFNDPPKKDNTRSQHQPYTETFVHKLTFIPTSTGPHLWCHPTNYFRKHHGHSSTSTFFWGEFLPFVDKQKFGVAPTKEFWWKNMPICQTFENFFLPEIAIFWLKPLENRFQQVTKM